MSAYDDSPVGPSTIAMSKRSDYVDQEKASTKDILSSSEATAVKEESDNDHGSNDSRMNVYVTGWKLAFIVLGFLLSLSTVALDQTILATAIPRIVSDFDGLSQVTWVAGAFFLTQVGLVLTTGQLLAIIPSKWVYLGGLFIFEIGSLICAVSPNMNVLIFGRAFAGVGAAAIFTAVFSITAEISSIEIRPLLFGGFASVFALASVAGPLIGGALTDHVTWRWCFYINLPIGGVAIASVLLFLEARPAVSAQAHLTHWDKFIRIDWLGTLLCLGFTTALVLPLQWGGVTKPWSDPSVIACFCIFGVVLGMFLAWENYIGERAMLPLSLAKRRSVMGASLTAFFLFISQIIGNYYIPLWYQATRAASATKSGLDLIPLVLSVEATAIISGIIVNRTGHYWAWLVVTPLFLALGGGLLFSTDESTSSPKLIGYQILYGIGIGGGLQKTILAVQADFMHNPTMIPLATGFTSFIQLIGGILGLAIAGAAFSNMLEKNIAIYAPNLPAGTAATIAQSVTAIQTLPQSERAAVVIAYAKSLRYVFIIGVPGGILATLSALFIKNHNLRRGKSNNAT